MISETMLMLSRNPDRVASTFHIGKEIWDDIFAKEFKTIVDEEIEKDLNRSETMELDAQLRV